MKQKNWNNWLMPVVALMLVLALLMGTSGVAQAAGIDEDGKIGKDEVISDDLLLDGANVMMDGTVQGNLLATGETVILNGLVQGDALLMGQKIIVSDTAVIEGNLFAFGQSISVDGTIKGSLFGGSSHITLEKSASVGRNLFYGGYSLETKPASSVAIDLFNGGYQAQLNGEVGRDVNVAAAAVELNGKVGRNVNLDVESPGTDMGPTGAPMMFLPPGSPAALKSGVRVAENAKIGGKLTYTSSVEQSEAIQSKPAGGIVFQTPVPEEGQPAKPQPGTRESFLASFFNWIWKQLKNLATLLVLGALVIWKLPNLLQKSSDQAREKTLPAAGVGLLAILAGYAGAILAAIVIVLLGLLTGLITFGGLGSAVFGVGFSGLTLAFTAFTLLVSYGSKLVVAFLVGDWVMRKLAPQYADKKVWALLIGIVIYVLLRSIPILGWLIGLVVTLIGLGAMVLLYQNWRKPAEAAPAPEIPAAV